MRVRIAVLAVAAAMLSGGLVAVGLGDGWVQALGVALCLTANNLGRDVDRAAREFEPRRGTQ